MGILDKRVAIVTGGSRGIGKSIALALNREGAKIIIADIKGTAGLSRKGKDFFALETDVSNKKEVDSMVQKVLKKFNRIDILVNNAGICETCPVEKLSEERWDKMMAINLKSVFLCSQAVIPAMKRQSYGKIINISSIAAKTGGLLVGAHYATSKAGIICFTKCLARELAPYGIKVNAVAPAITETQMLNNFSSEQVADVKKGIPLGRLAAPEDIAEAVVFLASEKTNFVTGETINVNGGSLME